MVASLQKTEDIKVDIQDLKNFILEVTAWMLEQSEVEAEVRPHTMELMVNTGEVFARVTITDLTRMKWFNLTLRLPWLKLDAEVANQQGWCVATR